MSAKKLKASPKKRFAVGAEVRVKLPGVNGTVTRMDSSQQSWESIGTRFTLSSATAMNPVQTWNLFPPLR